MLYRGALFRKSLAYARQLKPQGIYILSAKHGLLELEQEIDPYERTLKRMNKEEVKIWAKDVLRRLENRANLTEDQFVLLAGIAYHRHLRPYLSHFVAPMEGLSFGRQLKFLNQQLQ